MIMGEFDWKKNKHVVIPQGTKLTERMFQCNHSVETITLPDDIDSLPDYFCFDCKRLKAIYGGRNIKIIRPNTFKCSLQLHHLDFIPQIGYKPYYDLTCFKDYAIKNWIKIVRELKSEDFDDNYQRKQFGYILYKQNNEYLIWNITKKRFVFAVVDNDIPLYSYVSFLYKYSICFDTNNSQLNIERNQVNDVNFENGDDAERLIYSDDIKAYIEDNFSYINKINVMKNIVNCYIESLDIDKIIESYTISVNEHIRSKVGGDDTYTLNVSAGSEAESSDVYLAKLLPSYAKTTKDSGYCTFSYMSSAERDSYGEKENMVKAEAKRIYSVNDHFTSLMNAYAKYLYRRTSIYQEVLDAISFFRDNRCFIRTSWEEFDFYDFSLYWKDISEFVSDLNTKYYLHKEWQSLV